MQQLYSQRSCTPTEAAAPALLPKPALRPQQIIRGTKDRKVSKVTTTSMGVPVAFWLTLFPEHVCPYLDVSDVTHVARCSRLHYRAVDHPHVWRTLLSIHFRVPGGDARALDRMVSRVAEKAAWASGGFDAPLLYWGRCAPSPSGFHEAGVVGWKREATAAPQVAHTWCGSPPRPVSQAGEGTSSYGVTPTPPRHRTGTVFLSSRSQSINTDLTAATTPDYVPLRATLQQLLGATADSPSDLDGDEIDRWSSVEWAQVHAQQHAHATPLLQPAHHHFISHFETGLSSAPHTPHDVGHHYRNAAPRPRQFDGHLPSTHSPSSPIDHRHSTETAPSIPQRLCPIEPLVASMRFSPEERAENELGFPACPQVLSAGGIAEAAPANASRLLRSPELEETQPLSSPTHREEAPYHCGALRIGHRHRVCTEYWTLQDMRAEDEKLSSGGSNVFVCDDEEEPCEWRCYDDFAVPRVVLSQDLPVPALVCARTIALSLRIGAPGFPFRKLFEYLHARRGRGFTALLAERRDRALQAITYQDTDLALEVVSLNIQNVMEGGCGRSNLIRESLVQDLLLRGRLHRTAGRDGDALGDFALAWLLDPACQEAYDESAVVTTSANRCATNASHILSPHFSLDEQYDRLLCEGGTVCERAAFLFEVGFWRGPSLMLYLYQYLLCDVIKVWPVRLLLQAQQLASVPFEQLMIRAWILYDSGDAEKALEVAEMAVSLLPSDVSRSVDAMERVCTRIARQALHGGERWNSASVTATTTSVRASENTQQHAEIPDSVAHALREDIRRVGDVTFSSLMVLGHLDEVLAGRLETMSGNSELMFCERGAAMKHASFAYFTLAFLGGDNDVGVEAYRKHIFCRPLASRAATTFNNLGFVLLKRNQPDAALAFFERAAFLYPNHSVALRNVARCYSQAGRFQEALDILTRIVSELPTGRDICAETLFERSRIVNSPDDLKKSSERDPRLSHPYRLRAAMAMDRGNVAEALAELTTVIDLTMDPFDVMLRATFKRDAGDRIAAMGDVALACVLQPQRAEFRNALRELLQDSDLTNNQGAAGEGTGGAEGTSAAEPPATAEQTAFVAAHGVLGATSSLDSMMLVAEAETQQTVPNRRLLPEIARDDLLIDQAIFQTIQWLLTV